MSSQILCRLHLTVIIKRSDKNLNTKRKNNWVPKYRTQTKQVPTQILFLTCFASWGLEHVSMASDNGKPNSSKMQKKQCHLWFFSNMFQHITYESWNYQSDLTHNFGPRTEGLFSTVAQIGQQLEPESHRVSMDWFNIDGSVCVFHGANPRMIVIQCIVYI